MGPDESRRPGPEAARDRGAIDRHSDTLALLESLDVGKPLSIAAGDVAYAAECFEYFGSLAVQIEGASRHFAEGLAVTRREPAGVVGIITPFNFPLALSAVKIATALAAGCTVVHKPSEHTPLCALALAGLTREQDLPAGAYNVVTGSGADAGGAIVRHQEVAKIVFTGSTEIGARVAADAARTIKRVTMELGGKSANIVCADADIAAASARSHTSYTINAGQYCEAGSRLSSTAGRGRVVEHLTRTAEGMIVGDALAPTSELGPLINERPQSGSPGWWSAARPPGRASRPAGSGARTTPARSSHRP